MAIILVADDEAIYLTLLAETLLSDHHDVFFAKDGAEALELCASQKFDLIITDILMPNVDGIDLIMALIEQHYAVPVIAISGGFNNQIVAGLNLQSASTLGVHSILKKPFTSQCFLRAVKSALRA